MINPFTGREERLEPVMKDYMPGLTLHQHEVSLRNHGKVVKGTISEKGRLRVLIRPRRARNRKPALPGGRWPDRQRRRPD
ncbi:MAG: hypothetical protein JO122_17685 [Acetobacteraceae bacterium]|nr:hypothetical protein [Acetobacteraceae bacterium]